MSTQCDLPQSSDPERGGSACCPSDGKHLGLTCLNLTPGNIDTVMKMDIKVLPVPH